MAVTDVPGLTRPQADARYLLAGSPPGLAVPPATMLNPAAAAWPSANRVLLSRFQLPTPMVARYINWVCAVQSGNVQLGVVALSGANRTTTTRLMNSGVIACPAAGNIRTDLGATPLPAGDYAAYLWADNATFQSRVASASGIPGLRIAGSIDSRASGINASDTLAWNLQAAALTVEGDV